jgi:glycosyltransferase involved in cell wall biosynthesis
MRVLFVTNDNLSQRRAGPAVRCIELARVLARRHQVTVATSQPSDAAFSEFALLADAQQRKRALAELARASEVVVSQGLVLASFPFLARTARHLVIDLYDPYLLEYLAHPHPRQPEWGYLRQWHRLKQQIQRGDFFLCANERQRDYWIGWLNAVGRLDPREYQQDGSFRRLIDVVPFGLPSEAPRHTQHVMRGVMPGIAAGDFVLLWAGGLWQWLDPVTVIRGVAAAAQERPNIKLLFLGTADPNPNNRPMAMVEEARKLANDLGALERNVFFQPGWVRYDERQNWLLEADVGVSAHLETIEARFAFRTRVLDYIWAGLPMVLTSGDDWSDWISREAVGEVVPPGDVQAWKRAILALAADSDGLATKKARLQQHARRFTWDRVASALACYCEKPYRTARASVWKQRAVPFLTAAYDFVRHRR